MNTPIAVSSFFRRIGNLAALPQQPGFKIFLFTVGLVMITGSVRAELELDSERNQARLTAYVGMFNELANRRRKVVYINYPVSPYLGIVSNFVHVSNGSAAFSRTDMVVDAALPIVIRRAYHSGRTSREQFGNDGWRLTLEERIRELPNGKFVYRYGNGTTLKFDRRGRFEHPIDAFFSDVTGLKIQDGRRLSVTTRTGLTKEFRLIGNVHRLSRVSDAHGNALTLQYNQSRLNSIVSSDGPSATLSYDLIGRIESIQDSTGRRLSYAYDENGRLKNVVDVREQIWQFTYSDTGELSETITPNGLSDLLFEYDNLNRVTRIIRNGVPFSYQYVGAETVASDANGRQTRFRADSRGITQRVINAAGTETQIKFGSNGLPGKLLRNQRVVSRLTYEQKNAAIPRQISIIDDGVTIKMKFDRQGRVVDVNTGDSGSSYRVDYGAGLAPVAVRHGSSKLTRLSYDSHGEVASFSDSAGKAMEFKRNGPELQVTASNGRSATLLFNEFGQLERAVPAAGASAYFAYDNDGFRRSTRTSDGAEVDYNYDSTGNLFSTSVSTSGQQPEVFSYLMSSHNRLDSIVTTDSVQAAFEYNSSGLPVSTRSLSMVDLLFGYDSVGRLSKITPEFGAPLDYSYYPGEPDISIQLDGTTSEAVTQQKEVSVFASRMDVFLSRIAPSGFGYLTFDPSVQELKPFVDPRHWSPEAQVRNMIDNTRLEYLLADDGPVYAEFTKPSNRYFIPPELWAINCCFCCSDRFCKIP